MRILTNQNLKEKNNKDAQYLFKEIKYYIISSLMFKKSKQRTEINKETDFHNQNQNLKRLKRNI